MLAAVCVSVVVGLWLWWEHRHQGPPRLEGPDLNRLRRISEQFRRDSCQPFEDL